MTTPSILLIATLDTKWEEADYLRRKIEAKGERVILLDAGVLGPTPIKGDIQPEDVAKIAGSNLSQLVSKKDRGEAMAVMAQGAKLWTLKLFKEGHILGVAGLGGSAGTAIGTAAMRELPVGFPKLMVSTHASGYTRSYVGTKDIVMIFPVVDLAGLNRISKKVLDNGASAICGMVKDHRERKEDEEEIKPLVAMTMFGVTTPCVMKAKRILEEGGFEVLVFHATGTGGEAMEGLIRDGFFAGVLDVSTTELADELVGGILSAGPHRLEAAGESAIPQVVVPGALDMVNFGPIDTVPSQFKDRRLYVHNPNVTLMRTTIEENEALGKMVGFKLSKARGPVSIYIPRKGVSAIDAEGQPFYDPKADQAFLRGLKTELRKDIPLVEMDAHINDDEFAQAISEELYQMLTQARKTKGD
jgi:uncharacterized protein (UPF0261 family)